MKTISSQDTLYRTNGAVALSNFEDMKYSEATAKIVSRETKNRKEFRYKDQVIENDVIKVL